MSKDDEEELHTNRNINILYSLMYDNLVLDNNKFNSLIRIMNYIYLDYKLQFIISPNSHEHYVVQISTDCCDFA